MAIHRRDATGFYAIERFLAGDKRLHALGTGKVVSIGSRPCGVYLSTASGSSRDSLAFAKETSGGGQQ